MNKIAYKLLLFRIFCHTLYFARSCRNLNKCRFCTCFFIDDVDTSSYSNHKFRFERPDFDETQVKYLLVRIKGNHFMLSLHYVVSDFNDFYNVNENYGATFFQSANKPFTVYLIYLEVFLKVFFNKKKVITD